MIKYDKIKKLNQKTIEYEESEAVKTVQWIGYQQFLVHYNLWKRWVSAWSEREGIIDGERVMMK